jgi:hypothetical protein
VKDEKMPQSRLERSARIPPTLRNLLISSSGISRRKNRLVLQSQISSTMTMDPTYPLLPILSIVCSIFMIMVLATSFIRQSWNLGLLLLCAALLVGDLTLGINTIVWSDNADIKALVYCDIGEYTHTFGSRGVFNIVAKQSLMFKFSSAQFCRLALLLSLAGFTKSHLCAQ